MNVQQNASTALKALIFCLLVSAGLSLLPSASGQQEQLVAVDIQAPSSIQVVRDEAVRFEVTIVNPTSNPNPAVVQVDAVNVPRGWQTTWDPSTLTLAGGEQATVLVTVMAGSDATPGQHAFTLVAVATQGQEPLVATAEDRADVNVVLSESGLEAIRHDIGDTGLLLLAGIAALVIAIPAVMAWRRRAGGIELSAPDAIIDLGGGQTALVPVHVRNRSSRDDQVHLAVSGPPSTWTATINRDELNLRGKRSAAIELTVKTPKNAKGRHHVVVAASSQNATRDAVLDLIIQIR